MQHHASFGIVLRKDDKPHKDANPEEQAEDESDQDLHPVHKAAADGDGELLVRIIQQDPSLLEQLSAEGVTPLGQAVLNQHLEVVKKLIKMGANINAQDNVGRTCLSIAAYQGWHNGVVCLLRNGAKQGICDKSGRYPLHAATYHSDISTMTILLNGLTTKEINYPDHEMMTAVHWAAFHDRPDHLMQLLQKGGDVLARDVDGKLPLHWAAQNGSFQCTHRLISLNEGLAMVNDVDSSGKCPAHYAAAAGSANILRIIERCETADLEMEDPDERTPLHWAAAMGHAGAVEALLKLGVNPSPHDVDGYTPLDYAVQTGSRDCVKVLEAQHGHRTSAVKEKKKYQLSHEYLQQPKGKGGSNQFEPGASRGDVPTITVQAPTTTLSKATTNPGAMYPRMYSASTDTDAPAFQAGKRESGSGTPVTSRGISWNYDEPSGRPRHDKESSLDALSQLVGASFMAGARAPILAGPNGTKGNNSKDVERFQASEPTEQTVLRLESSNAIIECTDETEEGVWANKAPEPNPNNDRELHVMTSGNTPDIQRVSVQSFRSVPPIPPGSGTPQETPPAREHVDRTKGLCLQAARLTPLPGITSKSSGSMEREGEEILTPRRTNKLAPLEPLRGPLRVMDDDSHPAVTHRANVPAVDFMTENNAETRILTKKYKNTFAKWNEIAMTNQVPSNKPTMQPSNPTLGSTTTSPPAKTNSTQARVPAVHARLGESSIKFFKHSRIPSTRVAAQRLIHQAPVGSETHDIHGAPFGNNNSLAPPMQMRKGAYLTSTILSSAGKFRPQNERFIREEKDEDPPSPTPLANQPSPMLAATLNGKRRVHQRLVAASDTKTDRRKPGGGFSNRRETQTEQQTHLEQKHYQHQQQQRETTREYAEPSVQKHANVAEKKSVNFMMGTIVGNVQDHKHNNHQESHAKRQQRNHSEVDNHGRSWGGRVSSNRQGMAVQALKSHKLVRPKNERSAHAVYH